MREPVRGLAADLDWRRWLSAPTPATVGSSFDHAINLGTGDELLTLVCANGRPAPGTLITSAAAFPRMPAGAVVHSSPGWVRMGGLAVDTSSCVGYSCQAVPPHGPAPTIDPVRLREVLDLVGESGSFRLGPTPLTLAKVLRVRLLDAAQRYQRGLVLLLRGSPGLAAESVAGLVGLGIGLTPSGDDYLVGSLAGLWHVGTAQASLAALGSAIRARATTTTSVGRHFLTAAAEGRFHRDIADAATAVLTGADLEPVFRRVAAIGSTSGTDTLHGLVDTLSTWAASAQPHHKLKEFQ